MEGGGSGHFGAGAAARIEEAHRAQIVCCLAVAFNTGRLGRDLLKRQTKPGEVGAKFVREFRSAARAVDIFDAQEKTPA